MMKYCYTLITKSDLNIFTGTNDSDNLLKYWLLSYCRNTLLFLNLHTPVTWLRYLLIMILRYFRCKWSAWISLQNTGSMQGPELVKACILFGKQCSGSKLESLLLLVNRSYVCKTDESWMTLFKLELSQDNDLPMLGLLPQNYSNGFRVAIYPIL